MPEEREYPQFLEDVLAKLVPERTYHLDVQMNRKRGSASGELSWERTYTITDKTANPPALLDKLVVTGEGCYESELEMEEDETDSRESLYNAIAKYAEEHLFSVERVDSSHIRYSRRAEQAEDCKLSRLQEVADQYGITDLEDAVEFLPED